MNSPDGADIPVDIANHGQPKKTVFCWGVGHDLDATCLRWDNPHDPLDDWNVINYQQRFIAPHALAAPTGKNVEIHGSYLTIFAEFVNGEVTRS